MLLFYKGSSYRSGARPVLHVRHVVKNDSEELKAVQRAADRGEPAMRAAWGSIRDRFGRVPTGELEDLVRANDPQRIQAFVDSIYGEARPEIEDAMAGPARATGTRATSELGLSFSFDLINTRAVTWAATSAGELIAGATEEELLALRGQIARGIATGKHPTVTAREVRQTFGLTDRFARAVDRMRVAQLARGIAPVRVERQVGRYADKLHRLRSVTIARTEMMRASNTGQRLVWNEAVASGELPGTGLEEVWIASLDDRTDPDCENLDGTTVPFGTPWDSGEPPIHPNCLPGYARVSASGITGATARMYQGDLVVIRVAGGPELAATPNHPVLTDRGWMPIGELAKGDRVVRSAAGRWAALGDDDEQDMPARIEVVARAQLKRLELATSEVPVAAENFHGDGVGSEVAVVASDELLRLRVEAARTQELGHRSFVGGLVMTLPRPELLTTANGLRSVVTTAPSIVRGGDLSASLLVGHARPLDGLLLRGGTQAYPVPIEEGTDRPSTDVVPDRELVDRVAGSVRLDDIVDVRRVPFSGHVYNLQTKHGMYVAESIVTHNCRCVIGLRRGG